MTTNTTSMASICEQIRTAFNFDVDKFPLSGPDNARTPHYGLFRSDSGDCVGVAVRQGYTPHTVDDICALAEAAQDAFGGDCKASCLFRDGHYVCVQPTKAHRATIFGTKDDIWPRMIIRAGYDGSAFVGQLGAYRDACRNLHIPRAVVSFGKRIVHTHSLREHMETLRETFAELAQGWSDLETTAREMEARRVDLAAFIRDVYPLPEDASLKTRNNFYKRTEAIVRRIMRERAALGRQDMGRGIATGWEAFNGVQGYVQHDQRRHGKPGEFTRAILALNDAAVARAAQLALAV